MTQGRVWVIILFSKKYFQRTPSQFEIMDGYQYLCDLFLICTVCLNMGLKYPASQMKASDIHARSCSWSLKDLKSYHNDDDDDSDVDEDQWQCCHGDISDDTEGGRLSRSRVT